MKKKIIEDALCENST